MAESFSPSEIVRLQVNLHPTIADALVEVAEDRDISLTEAMRRAIALLNLYQNVQDSGQRLMIETDSGVKEVQLVGS